jgi:hypothetical protein
MKHPEKPHINPQEIIGERGTGERLKIFATLLRMNKAKRLADFINTTVYDHHLPLSNSSEVFRGWSSLTSEYFIKYQYVFLPPTIDFDCMQHKKFHSSTRMPFLDLLDGKERGAHGQVSKVRIHKDYQKWGTRTVRTECDKTRVLATDNLHSEM